MVGRMKTTMNKNQKKSLVCDISKNVVLKQVSQKKSKFQCFCLSIRHKKIGIRIEKLKITKNQVTAMTKNKVGFN